MKAKITDLDLSFLEDEDEDMADTEAAPKGIEEVTRQELAGAKEMVKRKSSVG